MNEIPESMILQMIGRAGRQQYNSTGLVYIMTDQKKKVQILNGYKQLASFF